MLIILVLISNHAFATAQFGDRLNYQGETVSIFSNPLESFFNKENPRPKDIFKPMCSACWRGYVATWKIESGYLYLIKLVEGSCGSNPKEIEISKVFPRRKPPVKATWFSGIIRIPKGRRLMYVHMGYHSIYEKELFLKFDRGELVKERLIDNTEKELPSRRERIGNHKNNAENKKEKL
jgi:hypothetical protein